MPVIAAAFGSSHSVMLTCQPDDWQSGFLGHDRNGSYFDDSGNACSYEELLSRAPANASTLVAPAEIANRYAQSMDAIARLKQSIGDARLDALIVIGDDQNELFDTRLMPSIGIYHGATIRNGVRREVAADQWYARAQMRRLEDAAERHYPCHQPLALHIIGSLMKRSFDVATISELADGQHEGHAFSFVHRFYLPDVELPIVPVFLNTFFPPNQPLPARCVALGSAIRDAVASYPGDIRIGIIASGGLSHFHVDEDLDRRIVEALHANDTDTLAALDVRRLLSGSSEIRNWIVLAGAVGDLQLDWLSYIPAYRTPALTGTGLCFAAWRGKRLT
jgi:hypothetical protein